MKLIKGRRPEDFSNIEAVLRYFSLLEKIYKKANNQDADTAKLFKTLDYEVQQFEKNFLMQACSIDFLAENLTARLPKKIHLLSDDCKAAYGKVGVHVDLKAMNYGELKRLLGVDGAREKIKDVFDQGGKFVEIIQDKLFLEGLKSWLPSLPQKLKDDLAKCYEDNKKMLDKIQMFYSSL